MGRRPAYGALQTPLHLPPLSSVGALGHTPAGPGRPATTPRQRPSAVRDRATNGDRQPAVTAANGRWGNGANWASAGASTRGRVWLDRHSRPARPAVSVRVRQPCVGCARGHVVRPSRAPILSALELAFALDMLPPCLPGRRDSARRPAEKPPFVVDRRLETEARENPMQHQQDRGLKRRPTTASVRNVRNDGRSTQSPTNPPPGAQATRAVNSTPSAPLQQDYRKQQQRAQVCGKEERTVITASSAFFERNIDRTEQPRQTRQAAGMKKSTGMASQNKALPSHVPQVASA